jgi:hypothetical protein
VLQGRQLDAIARDLEELTPYVGTPACPIGPSLLTDELGEVE